MFMHWRVTFLLTFWIAVLILLSSSIPTQEQAVVLASVDAPSDTAETVVAEAVHNFSLTSYKLFWANLTEVKCGPDLNPMIVDEFIRRIALRGSTIRTLFEARSEVTLCDPTITSNIVADSEHVYFVRRTLIRGRVLHRMPVTANAGDSIPTVDVDVDGRAELLISGEHVYVLTESKGLWRIDRESTAAVRLLTAAQVGNEPINFQSDDEYGYWLVGGQLKQMKLADSSLHSFGGSDITNYTLRAKSCRAGQCDGSSLVYLAVGNQIRRFNGDTRQFDKEIYSAATADRFDEMVVVGSNLFFVQEQPTSCDSDEFCGHNTLLFRMQRDGDGSPELIYIGQTTLHESHTIAQLTVNAGYLYWIDGEAPSSLKRLPQDASALPMTNLRITDVEVTQATQTLDNEIRLILGKRTFVRVHVRSDGDAVEGVTAKLNRLDEIGGDVVGETLTPVNSIGQYLTIWPEPNRAILDHSFLFELPMDWLTGQPFPILALRAEINPFKFPPQANYDNNIKDAHAALALSPSLDMRFVLFSYRAHDTDFRADLDLDLRQTISWIRRAYPLSSAPTWIGQTAPGFRPGYTFVVDHTLKFRVTQEWCSYDDDFCASDYVNSLLEDWDEEWINPDAPMYGMMPTYISPIDGESYFPRGRQSGDTANGPAGAPNAIGAFGWDVDGTYADWYAGHEIGHMLGRDHPSKNGDPDPDEDPEVGCGHSRDDDDYPHPSGFIGTGDLFGFDSGNPQNSAIMTPTIYPGSGAFDIMTYCEPFQWVSDYTYRGLENGMLDLAAVAQAASVAEVALSGDYLYLYAVLDAVEEEGYFVRVRRKSGVYTLPPAGSTEYAVRMLDAEGAELATFDVSGTEDAEEAERRLVTAELTYASGTRTVQMVHKPSGKVYASHNVSANPPAISNVALAAATEPVSGTVTLSWTASDADGDPLSFDVHYSIDNGLTFQPLQANLTGSSTQINTLEVGGSSQALFRVTAFDGGNTTTAATPPFAMANKPPVVHITNPGDGVHVQYGQLINFIGDALDPQWGTFVDSDLKWRSEDGPLGTGAMLPLATLPVGMHTITFAAKNSAGLEASTSITVYVDDDLAVPGPTLSVAPNQIGWHFDEGETTPQTAILYIANVGSGNLNWTASTPASWLSLSATSGTAPTQLTITADPSLMPAGENISSTILVSATVGSGQFITGQVMLPAHAAFGNGYVVAFAGPEDLAKPTLYLPVVER